MLNISDNILKFLDNNDFERILIHSDILFGFKLPLHKDKNTFIESHMDKIMSVINQKTIIFPTFNYDFCKGEDYSLINSPSQVGILSEYFRTNIANWRTNVPVFSFAGMGDEINLPQSKVIDPFGVDSLFHYLYQSEGLLMHYGSKFSSTTAIHYAERISEKLVYRYNKEFVGNVIVNVDMSNMKVLNYHVRPLNKYQDYDWNKIEKDLLEAGILYKFEEGRTNILFCNFKKLIDYWVEKLNLDLFYLLDSDSKKWIEPMIEKLGRPFLLTDFE